MTPRRFISNYSNKLFKKKVFALVGGSPFVQADMLMLLERRLQATYRKKEFVKMTYHLEDIIDEPERLLYPSLNNFRVIMWRPNILLAKKLKEILRGLQSLENLYTVFVDESKEIFPVFKKVFPKGSEGMYVECDKKPTKQNEGVEEFLRLRLDLVSNIILSECAIEYLKNLPFDALFNTIHVLDNLQSRGAKLYITAKDLTKYRLAHVDIERFLARALVEKGRREVLRYNLDDVDTIRLLYCIYRELDLLLKIKTMRGDKDIMRASALELPLNVFREYVDIVKKIEISELYRRLILVISSFRWAKRRESIFLFLMQW